MTLLPSIEEFQQKAVGLQKLPTIKSYFSLKKRENDRFGFEALEKENFRMRFDPLYT